MVASILVSERVGFKPSMSKPEWRSIAPATWIERLEESIQVLKALFADDPASFAGKHYAITELNGYPKPAQRPHPPIMIGGAGQRILALAAREADIIHFLPSTIATGTLVANPRDRLPVVLADRIDWVREHAGDRFEEIVLKSVCRVRDCV